MAASRLVAGRSLIVPASTGEVNRTWKFKDKSGRAHQVDLYHHTITGARGAMLDHEELAGSMGTSSVMHKNSTVWFRVGPSQGNIIIRRRGDVMKGLGFDYECTFDGHSVPELTLVQQDATAEAHNAFRVTVLEPAVAAFSGGGADDQVTLTWYPVHVERVRDSASTTVHRRFRDFADLDETVRASLSGHHMLSSLPAFPPKASKLLTNHSDPRFLRQRRQQLETFMQRLIDVPHVMQVPATLPFLGVANHMREVSFVFPDKSIGITVQRTGGVASKKGSAVAAAAGTGFPAVVELVRAGPALGVLRPGDILSKVNGVSTSSMPGGFDEVVRHVAAGPRPLVAHFLQVILHGYGQEAQEAAPPQAASTTSNRRAREAASGGGNRGGGASSGGHRPVAPPPVPTAETRGMFDDDDDDDFVGGGGGGGGTVEEEDNPFAESDSGGNGGLFGDFSATSSTMIAEDEVAF